MSIRDMTLSDVERVELRPQADAEVTFQMDEDTFRAFYDRTARPVWSYLARITGDRTLADDLLQETYYRFLRAAATYENEAHRRNSLFRIATNLARDAHRRRRLRPWLATQQSDLTSIVDAADSAGRLERGSDLDKAMARLKPRDRAMLWLAYAEGSSHREIAAAVGVQLGSVRLLLFRARRKLAELLKRAQPATECLSERELR